MGFEISFFEKEQTTGVKNFTAFRVSVVFSKTFFEAVSEFHKLWISVICFIKQKYSHKQQQ